MIAGWRIARGVAAAVTVGFLMTGSLAGCASNGPQTASTAESEGIFGEDNDPLETLNRFTFAINDTIDIFILKPIAVTYRFVVPDVVQDGVRNALRNLNAPVIFANDLMQGEFERAKTTFMRFVINSTIGVAGIFDVAADWGYEYHSEDFGQTLGTWGIGEGFYLVLPLIGPSSLRDAVGIVVDSYMDPWPYVLEYGFGFSSDTVTYISIGRFSLAAVDIRSRNIETVENIKKDAIDYYARVRTLYRQYRYNAITNGEVEEIPIPAISEQDWLKEGTPMPAAAPTGVQQSNVSE